MKKQARADGRGGGGFEAAPVVGVDLLRPALASIPGALEYLGGPSRAKFYADILPKLDIVKFGTRTFVTVASLDRLIAASKKPAEETRA